VVEARTYAEYEGKFDDEKPVDRKCPKCSKPMTVKTWESSCGGYEDEKYTCTVCGYYYWVDGPDS